MAVIKKKELTALQRFLFYLLFGVITITTPYILTIFSIIATGDRIGGMKIGFFYGLGVSSVIFGLLFIRKKWIRKTIIILVLATLNFGLFWLVVNDNLIVETGWGNYGYWDLALTYFLIGLIIWEVSHHIIKALEKFIKRSANPKKKEIPVKRSGSAQDN